MVDVLKRSLVSLICSFILVYTINMMMNGIVTVQTEYLGMNILANLSLIAIAGYVLLVYGVYPFYHPMQKRTLSVLWLLCIGLWQVVLLNDVDAGIYSGDMMKLFGVLLIWFGATWILSNNTAIQSQKKEKTLEIIEA